MRRSQATLPNGRTAKKPAPQTIADPQNANWRQRRILRTARACFLEKGFNQTRMEEVAVRAEVAKATLYKHFADKSVLFQHVIVDIFAEMRAQMNAVDARFTDGRIAAAEILIAKHKFVFRLFSRSAHMQELNEIESGAQLDATAELDKWVIGRISQRLSESGVQQPLVMAKILMACGHGILKSAQQVEEIGPATRLVASRLLHEQFYD